MSKVYQKVELTANILIIVVALLIGAVIVQKYFIASPQPAANQPPRVEPKIGAQMNVPDVNWSQQPKTLILALQADCRFCNDSAPFYKRVIETVRTKNVKLVAVFPTGIEKSITHLKELGLDGMEVKQSSLGSLQVSGTPTLILTNEKGEITDYWVGKLSLDKETEVINKLNS
jgi:thioredoxin-related protein